MAAINPTTIPHGYYAVPDPDQPDTITLWRSHATTRHGVTIDTLTPWPAKALYGPILWRRDVPKKQPERNQVREAYRARRKAWMDAVTAGILQDLKAAAALFAATSVHCSSCGRALTDQMSKELGIGPECRRPPGPSYSEEEITGAIRNAVETTKPGDTARTWTWDRPIQGRARKREKVTIRQYPDAVPQKACSTVLARLNAQRELCTGPVVWSVLRIGARALSGTAYYCDADLPAEYRPRELVPVPSPSGDVGPGEQPSLF